MTQAPLALLLLLASRWFDTRLRAELLRRGWPFLSPAQSLVFIHLSRDGISPASLARALGQSRQAASQLVAGLVELDLVAVIDDPHRRRGRLVCLTPRGSELAIEAATILSDLEQILDSSFVTQMRAELARLQ